MNRRISLRLTIMVGTFLLTMMMWLFLLNRMPPVMANGPNSLFVKVNGGGNACSQTNPCELAAALARARDGDIIYLAEGAYTDVGEAVISTTLSITMYGGWDGSPTGPVVRNPEAYPTILDGEGQRRVVYLQGPSSVVLDGFTITNGKVSSASSPWQGAGLYAKNVDLTLRNMTFSNNILDTFDKHGPWLGYGGGAHVEGGALVVDHVTFSRNKAWSQIDSLGGGLSVIEPTSVQVSNSIFQENDAWHGSGFYAKGKAMDPIPFTMTNTIFKDNGWGFTEGKGYGGYDGGAYIAYAQALLENIHFQHNRTFNDRGALSLHLVEGRIDRATFVENHSRLISALYIEKSQIQVANAIIANNRSIPAVEESVAIKIQSSQTTFLHASIANNEATAGLLLQNASVAITNTILVSHTVGISVTAGSTATLDHTLWGAGAWANGKDWSSDGEVTSLHDLRGDPAFVDPFAGDFHIRKDSAARDAGIDVGLHTDIDGGPRPFGPAPDIGADEWLPRERFYIPYVLKDAGE